MKNFFGLCILVILLVAASGCTQPAKPATVTPVETTIAVTEVPTAIVTMSPTVEITTTSTTAVITEPITPVMTTEITTKATTKPVMTPSTKVTTIYIRNNTFVPQELTVLPGTGITWINDDKTIHSIKTLPDSKFKFSSGDVVGGATFSYTYGDTEGTFGFIDTYTNATGFIIIKKGESVMGAPAQTAPVVTVTTP
jgi:plastocyanin